MIIDCRTAGRLTGALGAAAALAIAGACATRASTAPRFAVSFPESSGLTAVDGRVLVMLSTSDRQEPRFQVSDSDQTAQIFGVDVDGLRPGVDATVGETTLGYPIASLSDVPPGEYWVQGLLHVYETFARSDGHTVKLPPDRGEGQQWMSAPGNLYSEPRKVRIDRTSGDVVRISLDKKIPPLPDLPETKYIKRIRIQSERLTKLWCHTMCPGA